VAELVERVVAHTRVRLAAGAPDPATWVVRLHDPDARLIAKGRQASRVRVQGQVVDNADGVVLDDIVVVGRPRDAPMLVPAIARVTAGTQASAGGSLRAA